ncbi:MAG: DEAD/DEAH box helicase, partial [Nanoarchaeota archaeon]
MRLIKDKLNLRLYQQTILNSAIEKNTLVVLPTGLGKTHIAIALASLRLPQGKILVLAPTKPLVLQHSKVFSEFFLPKEEIGVVTGTTKQEERKDFLKNAKMIFATPQTIKHDLLSGKLSLKDFSLVVFDEAHRATGNYDYVFL